MECILIGTGGMMPMPYRLLTSLAVRLNGRIYLFDAGEGTQIGWKTLGLGVRGLKLIAVSHLHADHCLGIPGLMMLKAQMDDPAPLTVLGPPGIEEFVMHNQRTMGFYLNYEVHFIEWAKDGGAPAFQDDQVRIYWHPLAHTRFCLGYRLEERERPGQFSPKRAEAARVPKGPLWGKLQSGETIILEDGSSVAPGEVLGPPRRGRHVAFVVDTRPTEGAYKLCKAVDIAFIEGMFLPEDARHADEKGHMTAVEAAAIADRAGVSQAVLVHISPRYGNDALPELEAAAKAHFPKVRVGRDLETYPVRYPEQNTRKE